MLLHSQTMMAYRAFCEGREPDVGDVTSYQDFIAREQKYLASDRFHADQSYWNNLFTPVPDLVTLQTKKNPRKNIVARRKAFILPKAQTEQIRNFCRTNGITVFSFFLSMLTIYINRITGADDIVIGTPVLNRTNAREKSISGMFISTVPLRFKIDHSVSAIEYANRINSNWISILRHQQYPYDLLLRDLRKNNISFDNLFEVTLSYQNAKVPKDMLLWDSATRWHFSGYQLEPVVIHINDRDDDGSLILNYDYKISCFADREIEFIHSHLNSLIYDTMANQDRPIRSLSLIGSEELERIMDFNSTNEDFDHSLTFTELFQRQVDQTPALEAAVFHDRVLTFAELDSEANRLAYYLQSAGVNRDDVVAIMLPRGLEIISSMLGVMKCGGAFLPIDPTYPEDRVKYMLGNSGSKFIITSSDLATKYALDIGMVITPDDERVKNSPAGRLPMVSQPADLVYIIYTSGSTGLPKGVMIKQSGLTALMYALSRIMYFKSGEAVLSLSTIAFDLFILEVFPALINGMKIVIADEKEQTIPSLQKTLITKHQIAKFLGTPMRMQLLLEDQGSRECFLYLKEIVIGGDVFPDKLLKRIKDVTSAEILNAYGPTEITIAATFKNLGKSNEVNIGRPIANTKVFILDQHMNVVPIGVPGEIYIGGAGVGRGYLNNTALTNERFVPSPFNSGEMLYRTGDLGRWYPKGEIAYLGRIDSQVKIRGLRIELGEIENVIRQLPNISDVVVLDIDDQGKKSLCAYILPKAGYELDFHVLRNELIKSLPAYMVPAFYMIVETIPINANGKVDRRALPKPDRSKIFRSHYEKPKDAIEAALLKMWEETLDIQDLSCGEDFFDLGGDSMDIVSLVTAIHDEFGVEMTINDIYNFPTIKRQAIRIRELNSFGQIGCFRNLIPLRNNGAGRRLYLIHAGSGEVINYHKLCLLLSDNMDYYGLRYFTDDILPINLTITELASQYLEEVLNLQPNGPYYLAGWSVGGTIAFEMAHQLEAKGEAVAMLGLIDTVCPRVWDNINKFNLESEKAFLSALLPKSDLNNNVEITDTKQIWQIAVQEIAAGRVSEQNIRSSVPEEVAAAIPNFYNADATTLFKYINTIRTIHNARGFYRPLGILKAKTYFINASNNNVIYNKHANLAGWQHYCANPIKSTTVEGDHFSIFTEPHITGLSKILNVALDSN